MRTAALIVLALYLAGTLTLAALIRGDRKYAETWDGVHLGTPEEEGL